MHQLHFYFNSQWQLLLDPGNRARAVISIAWLWLSLQLLDSPSRIHNIIRASLDIEASKAMWPYCWWLIFIAALKNCWKVSNKTLIVENNKTSKYITIEYSTCWCDDCISPTAQHVRGSTHTACARLYSIPPSIWPDQSIVFTADTRIMYNFSTHAEVFSEWVSEWVFEWVGEWLTERIQFADFSFYLQN